MNNVLQPPSEQTECDNGDEDAIRWIVGLNSDISSFRCRIFISQTLDQEGVLLPNAQKMTCKETIQQCNHQLCIFSMIANKENWQPDCRGQICISSICFVGVCLADVCLHFSYDLCEILTRCILFAHRSSPVGVPTSNCAFPSLKWETQNKVSSCSSTHDAHVVFSVCSLTV